MRIYADRGVLQEYRATGRFITRHARYACITCYWQYYPEICIYTYANRRAYWISLVISLQTVNIPPLMSLIDQVSLYSSNIPPTLSPGLIKSVFKVSNAIVLRECLRSNDAWSNLVFPPRDGWNAWIERWFARHCVESNASNVNVFHRTVSISSTLD